MKKFFSWILIFLMIPIVISCHHNRLNTNEKELAKEILVQEKIKKEVERTAFDKNSFQTKSKTKGSFRKKEIRSVDPQTLPVRIDIMGTVNNTRKIKLSEVANSIRYVKLQTPPDTLLLYDHFYYRSDLDSKIISDGDRIIFQGLFGLTRFNMQGDYMETIWKNKTGIRFPGKTLVVFGGQDFFGVLPTIEVSLLGGNLYYNFQDGPRKTGQVLKYKLRTDKIISVQPSAEVPEPGAIKGDTLFITNKSWWDGFNRIYATSGNSWAGINNKWKAGNSGSLLISYNNKGDTLCQFTDYERFVNYSHGNGRNAIDLKSYYYNGSLTIKQEYNDTVFRLIPPERLLPVYILDFGRYKFNSMDGFNPDFDLSDKFMLNSLVETKDFLFIRYTQNYDCPATRKKSSVKFYNSIFDKKENKLFHQSDYTLLPAGLENDLDGGMPFWPEFITPNGEMMKLVSGRVLHDYINSDNFKKSATSKEQKQKQISMASGLRPTDMVLAVVK